MKLTKQIVILGAGFGGIYTYKNLAKYATKHNLEFTIVDQNKYFLFTPLLHELATGSLQANDLTSEFKVTKSHTQFIQDGVKMIDEHEQTVHLLSGKRLEYDYLVIALGSENNYYKIPGAAEHTMSLKNLNDAVSIFERLTALMIEAGQNDNPELLSTIVIGGGPTAVELATEIAIFFDKHREYYYPTLDVMKVPLVKLVTDVNHLLPNATKYVQNLAQHYLTKAGAEVYFGNKVTAIAQGQVTTSQDTYTAHTIIWAAGVQPRKLQFKNSIQQGVPVNHYLHMTDYPQIYAVGDVAVNSVNHLSAQAAVQQAQIASHNILTTLRSKRNFRTYKFRHQGVLISVGNLRAIGQVKGLPVFGKVAWIIWRMVYITKFVGWDKKVNLSIASFKSFATRK